MATSRKPAPLPLSFRHVWLAGLGLVSLAHRQARAASATLAQARRRAGDVIADVPDTLRTTLGRLEPMAMKLGGEVDARFGPLLGRIGLRARPAMRRTRATRTPARKTTPVRRAGARRTARNA